MDSAVLIWVGFFYVCVCVFFFVFIHPDSFHVTLICAHGRVGAHASIKCNIDFGFIIEKRKVSGFVKLVKREKKKRTHTNVHLNNRFH